MQRSDTWSPRDAIAPKPTDLPLREVAVRPVRLGKRVSAITAACWATQRERLDEADGHARAERLRTLATRLCERHAIEVRVIGAEPPPGSVIVANHLSYADTLVLPRLVTATCVAKRELATWPFLGSAAKRLGVVFVDRGCARSGAVALRRCARLLHEGVSVIVFPEGTTTIGDRLLPFRRGIFGIARHVGAAIVPAALRYDDARASWVDGQSFVSHYARTIGAQRRTSLEVWIGPAIRPCTSDTPELLAEWARKWIGRRLDVPLVGEPARLKEVA